MSEHWLPFIGMWLAMLCWMWSERRHVFKGELVAAVVVGTLFLTLVG